MRERWLLFLLPMLAMVPLLIPPVLPLTDIGAHIGRFTVQLADGAYPELNNWYTFQWKLVPNLGVDLLMEIFGRSLGAEPALKLIVSAIPALQVLGILLISRVVHGRITAFAILALPLAYALPLHYGFINYSLSLGLALIAIALWIRLGQSQRIGLRGLLFCPIGLVLWICHLSGWAVFCVVAACDAFVAAGTAVKSGRERHAGALARAGAKAGLSLVPLLLGPLLGAVLGPASVSAPIEFSSAAQKIFYLFTVLSGSYVLWDYFCMGLLVSIIILAGGSQGFILNKSLIISALAMLVIFWVIPSSVKGTYYVDMRLAPTIFVLFLLAPRPGPKCPGDLGRVLLAMAIVFTGSRFVATTLSLHQVGRTFERTLAVLDAVPRGAELITLNALPCEGADAPNVERRGHVGGYALARRHAFDNTQFVNSNGQPLRVHNPKAGIFEAMETNETVIEGCYGYPPMRDYVKTIPQSMQYLWVVGAGPQALDDWRAIAARGDSVLYARNHP